MAERVSTNEFEEKVLKNGKLSLIEFYSDSCVPCKRMSPVLSQLESEFSDVLYVGKVNVSFDKELVEQYEVTSTPTILFLSEGKEVERLTGAQKKADLEEIIQRNMNE